MKKFVALVCFLLLTSCLAAAILPANAAENVIFVADGGKGDGSSPDNPIGEGSKYASWVSDSYKKSGLNRAMAKLKTTGGTIVLCGPVTLKWGTTQNGGTDEATIGPDGSTPDADVKYTITSVYNGVDYRETADAALIVERNDTNCLSLAMKCTTVWDKVNFRVVHQSESCAKNSNFVFSCNSFATEFTTNFTTEVFLKGESLDYRVAENAPYFPVLAGGHRYKNQTGTFSLLVNGGKWRYVCGGCAGLRYGESSSDGLMRGNATVTFGGYARTIEGIGGGSFETGSRLQGNVDIKITGGTVSGSIDLGGRGGFDNNNASANLTVTGGNFDNLKSINDVGSNAPWSAPDVSTADFSALKAEKANALLSLVTYLNSVKMPDGSTRTFSVGEDPLPDAVIERLRSTPYSQAQYKKAYDAILAGDKNHSVLDLLAMLSAKPTNAVEGLDVPANTDVMRERTIEYFDLMSQIEWSTPKTLDYRTATTFTTKLVYEAGQTYTGMIYSSSRKPSTSIEEFSTYLNGNKQYIGPTDYPYLMGVDCGAPRLAWAYGGALVNAGLYSSDFEFMINYNDKTNKVITTVGEYDTSGYKSGSDINAYTSFDRICKPNGEKVMFEAYALIRPCDYVVKRSKGSSSTTDQHILLAVEDAAVFRNKDGSISGARSHLTLSEQTCTIYNVDGKKTTWRLNEKRSFNDLYTNGYIPLTLHSLKNETVEKPDLTFDKGSYQEGIDLVGRGTVKSNYALFAVNAVITDASGKTVASAVAYPYALSINLANTSSIVTTPPKGSSADTSRDQGMSSFNKTANALPAGTYTYTLTATIGFGTKTVTEFTFTK